MHKFKVGDKLDYPADPSWNGSTVTELHPTRHDYGYKLGYYVTHPDFPGGGLMYEDQVEAHAPPRASDEEVAAQWRDLMTKANALGKELHSRGYTGTVRWSPAAQWSYLVFNDTTEYLFKKTETITKEL